MFYTTADVESHMHHKTHLSSVTYGESAYMNLQLLYFYNILLFEITRSP